MIFLIGFIKNNCRENIEEKQGDIRQQWHRHCFEGKQLSSFNRYLLNVASKIR